MLEQDGCVVGNKTYAVGESFNPTMSTPGSDYSAVCYNCTCYVSGACAVEHAQSKLHPCIPIAYSLVTYLISFRKKAIKATIAEDNIKSNNLLQQFSQVWCKMKMIPVSSMITVLTLSLLLCLCAAVDVQNLIPLCLETHCPELNCEHPVRINGECCSICMEPGIYK